MDISDDFGPGCFAMDVRIKITVLPELRAIASQFARSDLFERLQKLSQQNLRRLVDQQVDMLRHQDISVHPGLVTRAGLLQNGFEGFLGFFHFKKRKTAVATEGDEVKCFGFLEPLQAVGHGAIVTPMRPCPKTRSLR